MFKSARIKLTLWYLLIIMAISISFSTAIYFGASKELERGLRRMEIRHRAEEMGIPLPRFFSFKPEDLPLRLRSFTPRYLFPEEIKEAKKRVLQNLLVINSGIFVFAGLAGYFLAGKTLSPIEKVLEEQKRFIADASHELKTPLTALKTTLEVSLRDKNLNLSSARDIFKDSLEEVNNLVNLTDRLLKISRLETNENHTYFTQSFVKDLINEAIRKVSPLAKKKKITIKAECPENIKIVGDKEGLLEMLTIFLDNGVKYTPNNGEVSLLVSEEKNNVVIIIKDTGIGISEKDLPHIFDRFYRADQSRSKNKVPGFGLGLSLAKGIIEKHSGKVEVKSKLGKGTSFTIYLPLKQ